MDSRVMVGVFGCDWVDISNQDEPVEMHYLTTEKSQK